MLKSLFVFTALVSIVFGLADILVPRQVIALWGLAPSDELTEVIRLFGVFFVMVAVLAWQVRDISESNALWAIVFALFLGDALGVVVSIFAIFQLGGTNVLGWASLLVYLILAAGFGYVYFSRSPSGAGSPVTN